jgi:hypothetical protein
LGGAGTALAFTYLVVLGALDWRRLRENIRILRMSSPIPEALS